MLGACEDSWQCMNGGACEGDGYRYKFCRCLEGTTGGFCEIVTGCINKECGEHAQCKYDVSSRIAVCVCDDESYAFDPIHYECRSKFGDMLELF